MLGGVLKYLVGNFTALNSRVGGTFVDFLSLEVSGVTQPINFPAIFSFG